MINDKFCQHCGYEVGPGGPYHTEATLDVPLCKKCREDIMALMRKARLGYGYVVVDLRVYMAAKRSPISYKRTIPGGKRLNRLYWPEKRPKGFRRRH